MDEHRKDRSQAVDDNDSTARTPNKPEHTFLTTGEAAHFLRLSARTLERFRVEGTGPRYTKAGPGMRARVLYRRSDLEDWLQSFQYDSTSQYGPDR
jgi:Helix-turn-helix domain